MKSLRERPGMLVLLGCLILATTACGQGRVESSTESDASSADYVYIIPEGTADRLVKGETVDIMPTRLTVKVGEVIRIENRDDEGSTAGPFYAPAHTTITQKFTTPGKFIGECVLSADGTYEIVVEE